MLISIVPVLVFLVGLLTFALAKNPDVKEIGRISLFCGLLVTLFVVAKEVVRVG